MDCEKFESLLIDELYGELDEVTSAAVRRHAAGCARCGALLSGFRATRKVAALPMEEPSGDLEDRILSAVREQQKVLPFRARASTALSRAGAWAMRPQTAMAAVFLLVIGTSFVLVQSRKVSTSSMAASDMANAEGAPVQGAAAARPAPMASAYSLDDKNGDFAHGVEEKRAEQQHAITAPSVAANADGDKDKERAADITTLGRDSLAKKQEELALNGGLATAGTRGALEGPGRAGGSGGGVGNWGAGNDNAPAAPMAVAQSQAPYGGGGVSFNTAKQLYDARRFDDARTQWDALAPADPNAALWAARADKAKNGCTATVIQRFEQVRARAGATTVGNEATLEAGRCYRVAGNTPLARARFSGLLQTQNYAAPAQNELDQMTPASAAHKAAARPDETRATTPNATSSSSF